MFLIVFLFLLWLVKMLDICGVSTLPLSSSWLLSTSDSGPWSAHSALPVNQYHVLQHAIYSRWAHNFFLGAHFAYKFFYICMLLGLCWSHSWKYLFSGSGNVQCTMYILYILLCLKKFKNISTGCFCLIKRCLKVFKRRNKIWVNKQNVWSKLKLLSAQRYKQKLVTIVYKKEVLG